MSITGALTGFPINTILEFADRNIHGIGNIMTSTVRPSGEASFDQTASEHAISLMITEITGSNIGYSSIPGGEPFFDSVSTLNSSLCYHYANYNTIAVTGDYLTLTEQPGVISIAGTYEPDIYIFNPAGTSKVPIQGGKYQYFASFEAQNDVPLFDPDAITGALICHAQPNDCIGKFFIREKDRVFSPTCGMSYSIGTLSDPDKYVLDFPAPSAYGTVNFEYNIRTLSGGYSLVTDPAGEDIYLFRYNSTTNNSAVIGISIFYDKMEWNQNNGYFTRNNTTEDITKFSFSNNVFQALHLYPSYSGTEKTLGAANDGTNIYAAGGTDSYGQILNGVETFNPDTTTNMMLRAKLTIPRNGMGTFKDSSRIFFAGGSQTVSTSAFNNTGSQGLESYNYSNGAMSVMNVLQCYRYMPLSIENGVNQYAYIYGGQNTAGAPVATVEKYNMTTDVTVLATPMSVAKMGAVPFRNTSYMYFGPGFTTDLAYTNRIHKMNISTETVAVKNAFLSIYTAVSQTLYNNTDAYICFGIGIPHVDSYDAMTRTYAGRVEKMPFATEVTSVIEAWTGQNLGTSPAGSI